VKACSVEMQLTVKEAGIFLKIPAPALRCLNHKNYTSAYQVSAPLFETFLSYGAH
jgi:hypothetical protein